MFPSPPLKLLLLLPYSSSSPPPPPFPPSPLSLLIHPLHSSPLPRLKHEATCAVGSGVGASSASASASAGVEEIVAAEAEKELEANSRANRKSFLCDDCGQTFIMTPVESLRHRKNCARPA